MIEVIGVKFKSGGKMYYFAPGDLNPAEGSYVVVETARGPECGKVAARRHAVRDESITAPLKPILRLATEEDLQVLEKRRAYMDETFRYCEERIAARNLPMHLVDVECGFESNKLIFYFTAESRVDFRELVKDLALQFHVRIELRQIGDRDEAKLIGGLGTCGREFCCKGYLNNFQPISIKMAKEQGLALNPSKISGACGRLMCCLRYESPVYEELIRMTPRVGSTVILPGDTPVRAYVMEVNLVTGNLRVKPENSDMPVTVHRDNIEFLQDQSRRMTKEDLKEKSDAKSDRAPQKGASRPPKQQHADAKPAADTKSAQNTAAASALHPEFGETRQKSSTPQPQQRSPQPLDNMDFTEHRAAAEHPAGEGQEQQNPAKQQQNGNRRYHRNGQNHRRFHNNHRNQNNNQSNNKNQ